MVRCILGVAAGKGGVGKSTVCVQIARVLRQRGFAVGILDADLYGPSIRKMLTVERLPQQSERDPEKIVPAEGEGIRLISMSFFRDADEPALIRAPLANAAILQFLHAVEWGELDCLIIDLPPGTGDIHLTVAQQGNLSACVLVTTPQEVAVLDVRKAWRWLVDSGVPMLGIIENMAYCDVAGTRVFPFGRGGGESLALETGVPLLGQVPLSQEISGSGDRGVPLGTQEESAQIFEKITSEIWRGLVDLEQHAAVQKREFTLVWCEDEPE